ncbi:MAG TPA: pyruvate:ferredoxin (flavodoxin) oxidoreductase, partial [Bacteroidota bacterium]|nr:pyruvate:ferredoxin (flavodoxin) oxidoreductase [Bacteroidota bacterium]
GMVPSVTEMQSEGGAAGAIHGALQTGALSTTFTSSQGLLLMLPNMFKIAGELTSTVFHVAARSVATHALSIFGDHSDVMTARNTGFALLSSNSVQEVLDFAAIAQAATLESRIPVLHFFDGFRTSHELAKIETLTDDELRRMIDETLVLAHRARALSPDRPVMRGTAQNPDVFFQSREAINTFYNLAPEIFERQMEKFGQITGRRYRLYEYVGPADAESVIVIMGSGAETAEETVHQLNGAGRKVGLLKVRLFRPFSVELFIAALPRTIRSIAVLDRTKEPGSAGEPLYLDTVTAVSEGLMSGAFQLKSFPRIIGGRYGLSSKEFTPAMVKAVFDNLESAAPKNHFTIGIDDDVTGTSLPWDPAFAIETEKTIKSIFYGLGADGTVSANKNSIKIIGEETDLFAQGFFVYDSKKSGSTTTSHLRFGTSPIRAPYLVDRANFIACHQWFFLEKVDMLKNAAPGATFLMNSMYGPAEVWDRLPKPAQDVILKKKLSVWVIDAYKVARENGMGSRINTVMQTCFFALSKVLPREDAIAAIKRSIEKSYGKKGEAIVKQNFEAVDQTLANLHEVSVPSMVSSAIEFPPTVSAAAPEFVRSVTARIIAGDGDSLPVSAFPVDGTFPTDTARWEKRNIALEIPVWDEAICIQCNKCALVCPHAAIRVKVYDPAALSGAPAAFKSVEYRGPEYKGRKYTVQVAPEDCTGCTLCVEYCPVKNKSETRLKAINMMPQAPLREAERANYDFFLSIPETDRRDVKPDTVKGSQFLQPLFEYSGACSGCGETPYVKLASQLFGDRMLVANATGCSSIYGGNLPTTPWAKDSAGRGPAWSNSLFEDNAEFGLGMRLTVDKHAAMARDLVERLAGEIGPRLAGDILAADQSDEAGIFEQRLRVQSLKDKLKGAPKPEALRLLSVADMLVKKSVWIMGGDGWAYDIGYGGLDHILNSGKNVNILVLDTEVYSNTGGQMSKATPRSAVAKFAAGGKPNPKKDLGMLAMSYRNVYVAQVAMGANDSQTVRAFIEAEAFDGPSIIIAYSHCIAHGINMAKGMANQKVAAESGYWPLYRYNPALAAKGENPFKLDSKPPKLRFADFSDLETRYRMLHQSDPDAAKRLAHLAQEDIDTRWATLELMAKEHPDDGNGASGPGSGPGRQPAAAAQTSENV